MEEKTHKEYSNDTTTVVWKPDVCIHAGECVKSLPEVFKPNERPWVQIENASSDAIIDAVNRCPSGALFIKAEARSNDAEGKKDTDTEEQTKIRVMSDGPLLVKGNIELQDVDGALTYTEGKSVAFCRCGASAKKPLCDGSHSKVGFKG